MDQLQTGMSSLGIRRSMTSPVRMFFRQPRGNNHPIEIWRICIVAGRYLLGWTHSEVEDIIVDDSGP